MVCACLPPPQVNSERPWANENDGGMLDVAERFFFVCLIVYFVLFWKKNESR